MRGGGKREFSRVMTFLMYMDLRSLILISSFQCPNNLFAQVWWKSRHFFRKYGVDKHFPTF